MGRNLIFKLLPILLVFLLFSCKPKPLDIDISPAEEKMVISSQLLFQQGIAINLTKSFSSLDNIKNGEGGYSEEFLNNISIKNAIVTVTYNNITDTLTMLESSPGVYYSLTVLQYVYQDYLLMVWDSYLKKYISASSTLLPKVNFNSIESENSSKSTENSFIVNYTIKDLDYVNNWYMVSYSKLVNGKRFSLKRSLLPKNIPINKSTFIIQNPEAEEIELFTDNNALNNIISRSKKLTDVSSTDTVIVALINVEEGYYNFLNTKIKAGGLANSFGNEPINYKTNVNGGYGFFTTHSPSVVFLNASGKLDISSLENIDTSILNFTENEIKIK